MNVDSLSPTAVPSRHRARVAPAQDASDSTLLYQGITCMAGFYAGETQAREAMQQMAVPPLKLRPGQFTLLAPARGVFSWWRRGRNRWALQAASANRQWFDRRWLMLGLAAIAAVVAVACALAMDDNRPDTGLLMLGMFIAGFTALVLGTLTLLRRPQSPCRRFTHTVGQQLAARRWVLLVHKLPTHSQPRVFALVRSGSVSWCVAAAKQQWI